MEIRYILLEEVTAGEPVSDGLLEELLALDLVRYRREPPARVLIEESHCETLRTMLRLATDLGINAAGVETIIHMRGRLSDLQREVRRLRQVEAAYHALRPATEIEQI